MKTVGVEFKKGSKQYTFFDNNIELEVGDNVVVETERGLQFGTVCSEILEINDDKISFPIKDVIRIATVEDKKNNKQNKLN